MKINYKGKEAKVAFALSPVNEGAAVSIRIYSDGTDTEGNPTQETLGSKVFTTEACGQAGLEFVADFKRLLQSFLDSEV